MANRGSIPLTSQHVNVDFLNNHNSMAKKPITEQALAVLNRCIVVGNNVKLPAEELDKTVYLEVKKHLELIGGKWKSGKTQAFVFEEDPTELLAAQANGDGRDLKREYQFFATPEPLAKRMASLIPAIRPGMKVLEPSAGDGALIKAIHQYHDKAIVVDCFEPMEVNRLKLSKLKNVNLLGEDFMTADLAGQYDVIIANPPFTKNQDIDHIRKMYECLKTNGKLVVIASKSWTFGTQKKQVAFRQWMEDLDAFQEELEPGVFGESGTQVATMLLAIDKLEEAESDSLPGKSLEQALAELPASSQNVVVVDMKLIFPDQNQPRKHFHEAEISELADSIRVHGLLQPITVRPFNGRLVDGQPAYKIVFGERRWRAATAAGCAALQVFIRTMTDEQALELQIIENLQRKDVHPLEEGEAFKVLAEEIRKHHKGQNPVKEIAARIGKSEKYVNSRIRLCWLIPDFKEMYYQLKMTFQQAIKLSRLPEKDQSAMYKELVRNEKWRDDPDYTLSFSDWNLNNKLNSLDEAPFKTEDAELYQDMGACGDCVFNSANSLALFPKEENMHICSNAVCYNIKCQRNFEINLAEAAKDEEVIFISEHWGGPDKNKLKALEKIGREYVSRNSYKEIDNEPVITWEQYLEQESWWEDREDMTPEEKEEEVRKLKNDYEELVEEHRAELEEIARARLEGRIRKALIIEGHKREGQTVEIMLQLQEGEISTPTKVQLTPQEQIEQLKNRELSAQKADRESVWDKVQELFDDETVYLSDEPLTNAEIDMLYIALLSMLDNDRSFYNKYFPEGRVSNDELIEKFGSLPAEAMNYITRMFLLNNINDGYENYLHHYGVEIGREHFPEKVRVFELEQEEIRLKREEEFNKKITKLEKELAKQ